MSQIDLRNAVITIEDGYEGPVGSSPKVDRDGGYDVGDVSIAIDAFAGVAATGSKFKIAGQNTVYTITAHTETLSNTTNLTFTPALTAAVTDNAVVTIYDVSADTVVVNNGAGYSIGTSTMMVDGTAEALVNGDLLLFTGDTTIYTVTGHSETLGATTSITFTPTLVVAVLDNVIITRYGINADTALTNHTALSDYTIGTTTMQIDGVIGALEIGDRFTLPGSVLVFVISAHTETGDNTTSVTFAPGIDVVATDNAVITILPHSLYMKIGDGNLVYDEKRTFKYIDDRGVLDDVRLEKDVPMEIKMELLWEFIKASTGQIPTPEDALKNRGGAASWVSSATDKCQKYAVNIKIVHTPPCTEELETITLRDYRWEALTHDLRAGMLNTSGKCNVTEADIIRSARV